jgi:caa(3)-type oxidase subunit IV
MAQQAHAHEHEHAAAGHGHDTHHGNYVRVWAILCVLLVISVLGPFLGHPAITLITAFGIAVVKAYLVAKNFMHITVAPRYVAYLIGTCLVFMLLFFAGAAPDVMELEGTNWEKPGWKQANAEAHEAAAHGAPAHH